MLEKKRVTVKRMFKGGQKPDGWFGCFAKPHSGSDMPITGVCKDTVREGVTLDIEGEWKTKNGFTSFVCKSVLLVTNTRSGIINYFKGRRFPRVGEALAQRLYDTYGESVFSVIENTPERLKQDLNLEDGLIAVLTDGVRQNTLENFLRKWLPTLTDNQVMQIERAFGNKAIDTISRDPYVLLNLHIPFKTVDELAIKILHLNPYDDMRIEIGTLYIMRKQSNGDMYVDLSDDATYYRFYKSVMTLLYIDLSLMDYANRLRTICSHIGSKLVIACEKDNHMHLYDRELYDAELIVSRYIRRNACSLGIPTSKIVHHIDAYEAGYNVKLADEQKQAVIKSVGNKFSCITGGPGRGKTSVVSCLARASDSITGSRTLLLAPTGKAAKRLAQATGLSTMTLAKFLYHYKEFVATAASYISYSRYVIDEASMVSIKDMAKLMDIIMDIPVSLTLVGDVDQLPPIDPGNPFADIIRSGVVPTSYLKVNHRTNSRSIIDNADRIHDGNTALKTGLSPDGDIEFLVVPQKADDAVFMQYVVDLYKDSIRKKNMSDIAVICPMNDGDIAVRSLNLRLQNELNKEYKGMAHEGHNYSDTKSKFIVSDRGTPIPGMFYGRNKDSWTNFRIGDRVMQTVNHAEVEWFATDEEGVDPRFDTSIAPVRVGYGVFNGDCGTVLDYTPANDESPMFVTVGMDDGRIVRMPEDMLSELVLAYAMTVHKSQGCEYDTVIYVSPFRLLSFMNGFACRNLVYTAVTRAKNSVQIIGSKEALDNCIRMPAPERKSMLVERIK